MSDVLTLDRETVVRLLDIDDLLAALRSALIELSAGNASVPPRPAAFTKLGLLAAMPGYLPGAGLGVKLVSVFDGNESHSLPSHQAVIMLNDPDNGSPLAIMDGTHITAVRTAASAAVAAQALARPDSHALAILGSGVQARQHLAIFSRCFDLTDIRVAARNCSAAETLASGVSSARSVPTFEEAVNGADIVCCCTNAEEPVMSRTWLAPGVHVSSVGRGAELDTGTVGSGSVFVEWRGAVTNPPPAGAVELQGLDPRSVTEVGEVLAGRSPGRTESSQLTVYKSTGHAVEDLAAAALVFAAARATGAGTHVNL